MSVAGALPIYIDFEVEVKITRKNSSTGVPEPATGLTGMTARISATDTGSALSPLTVSLTERGTTGIYAGVFDTADLVTALGTTYLNQTVYLIYSKSGDIDRAGAPYVVRDRSRV